MTDGPSVAVGESGSMLVHHRADKTSSTTHWSVTACAGEHVDEVDGGGGRIGSVSADHTVGAGPSGTMDATSNASTGNANDVDGRPRSVAPRGPYVGPIRSGRRSR